MTMKLELVPIPVTDVDRAKAFDQVGFRDSTSASGTSSGSCSLTPARLRRHLHRGRDRRTPRLGPGPAPGRPRHPRHPGRAARPGGRDQRGPGHERPGQTPSPTPTYFKDPDGNGWALQQLPY